MTKDNRRKGCPNCECIRNEKKFFYKSEDQYCTICGTPLIFVCKKCFSKIEDSDIKHIRCVRCQAEYEDKRQRVKEKVGRAGASVAATAVTVGVGITKIAQNEVIKQGGNLAKQGIQKSAQLAAKTLFKK